MSVVDRYEDKYDTEYAATKHAKSYERVVYCIYLGEIYFSRRHSKEAALKALALLAPCLLPGEDATVQCGGNVIYRVSGCVDTTTPQHIGTRVQMNCPSCADAGSNGKATLCRECCPTQHGTHWVDNKQ